MKRIVLFILLIFVSKIYSQSLSGVVLDEKNEPVSMVVVQVLENNNVVAYSITSDDGKFSFNNLKTGNYTLSANHISYEKITQNINLNNDIKNLKISLKEKVVQIKEVVIQHRAPLGFKRGDTLAYNLKAVTDGNERKLKEVLSKLPGVEVNPVTGKVMANGKVVDDLLINGQRLFGKNHKLATENINAEMLEEISLINNYEKFGIVKDIEGGDKTAINIKIKEEFLGKITGEVEAMGAYENRYKLHPKLFQFGKKHSLSLIAKADNMGEEVMTLFDFIELNSGIKSDIRGGDLSQSSTGTRFPSFLLSDKNVDKKQNEFLSLYSVLQPKENWSINSYIIGNHSNITENILSRKHFYAYDYLVEDSQRTKLHTYNILSKINSEYYIDANTMFNYSLSFSKNEADNESIIGNSYNNIFTNYNQTRNPNFITLGHQLSFIKKITKFSLISLNAYHEFKKNNNFLDIDANTFLFDTNQNNFAQQIKEKSQEYGAFAKYTLKLDNENTFTANTGFNSLAQRINYHNTLGISDFINRGYLFSNVSLSHKKSKLEYGLAAELRNYLNEDKTFFIPQILARYNFKENFHYIDVRYNRDISFPEIMSVNNTGYATNFRNYYLASSVSKTAEILKNIYQLRYSFMDLYNGITFYLYSRYTDNDKVITRDYNVRNNISYASNSLADGGFQWINNVRFGLNVFKIRNKINITGGYNLTETPLYRNGILDKNDVTNASLEIDVSSNFKKRRYNYEAGFMVSNTKSLSRNNNQKISLTEYIPKLNLTINLGKNITGYFNNSYHFSSSDGFENNFWELNYKLYYKKPSSKWSVYLVAEDFLNLNGNKTLISADRSVYFETQQIERLSGFVGAGLIFDFK